MNKRGNIPAIISGAVAIIAIFFATYFYFQIPKDQSVNVGKESKTIANTTPDNPTVSWKTYTFSDVYSVNYPQNSRVEELQDYLVISEWGQTQKAQTELYDGYSVRIRLLKFTNQSLSSYVQSQIDQNQIETITKNPKNIVINSYQGIEYSSVGLGEHRYILIQDNKTPSKVAEITITVSGPTKTDYENRIDQILSTFKFTN